MADQGVDTGRRRFLTATTAVVGGVGGIYAAVPFIKAWQPSAKAQLAGAPVTVDIGKLEEGQMLIQSWRGQPVWIFRRNQAALAAMQTLDARLRDPGSENPEQQPGYAKNPTRSIKPEIAVLVGTCTHLGCSPKFKPDLQPEPFDTEWKGGFYCPCHNSRFDLAGRVFQSVPAPANLKVPPYHFVDDNHIVVGVDPEGAA